MKYSSEEDKFLKNNYSIYGRVYCAEKLNRSAKSIGTRANKLGLKVSPKAMSKLLKEAASKPYNEYKVNPIQFMKYFTKESAYILGLLFADGSIYNNRISLECIKTDTDIFLPAFQKTGDWTTYYRHRKNKQPQCAIRTNNRPLSEFLISMCYGPHNTKSPDTILKKIPENLHPYFFRGLSDGDGCFYVNKNNSASTFSLYNNYKQNWNFVENLYNKLNIKYYIHRLVRNTGNKISTINIYNRPDIIKFGTYIYDNFNNDNIGLPRKYNKFISIKNF